nr:hypothetical protein [Desulfobacterales bacterium]
MTGGPSGPSFLSLKDAARLVVDGSLLAVGGRMQMEPVAFVRELVRQGRKRLRLLTVPGGGINVDMLVGAGCVESVETPQVVLNEFGQAPNFRRQVQKGKVKVSEQV